MQFSIDILTAVSAAKEYCKKNGLDYKKVDSTQAVKNRDGEFVLFCKNKGNVSADGLVHDLDSQPFVVLVCDKSGRIYGTEHSWQLKSAKRLLE